MLDRRPAAVGDSPDDRRRRARPRAGRRARSARRSSRRRAGRGAPRVRRAQVRRLWDRRGFHRAAAFQPRTKVGRAVTTPSHIVHILSTLADGTGRETHTVTTMDSAKSNAGGSHRRSGSPRRLPPPTSSRDVVFDIDDLAVSYGKALAVAGVTLDDPPERDHRADRPVGLRQVDRAALPEPHERPRAERARSTGRSLYHGVDLYGHGVDPIEVRRRIGMVFQRPNPFPKSIYDNVAYGLRILGMKDNLDDRVEQALARRRPLGRGEDAGSSARRSVSPAASSSDSASRARSPSSRT